MLSKRHKSSYRGKGKIKTPPRPKEALIYHTIKRARERFRIKLSVSDVSKMSKLIRNRKAKFLFDESCSRQVFLVPIRKEGLKIPCVYNRKLGCIATVLKTEWVEHDLREGVCA